MASLEAWSWARITATQGPLPSREDMAAFTAVWAVLFQAAYLLIKHGVYAGRPVLAKGRDGKPLVINCYA